MNQRVTYGIVGGSGATGRLVASELAKDSTVLIGARDRAKLEATAAKIAASTARVDVLDDRSLDDFCSRCSIVINCAGPVMLLQDRVARAAFRARNHYIDPAGLGFVKEGLSPHTGEIADSGLSFVVSAGWMPGIIEVLPVYAHAAAKSKMDSIESVKVYFTDSGEWSENAVRDGFLFLRQQGLPKPGYFRKGDRVRVKMSKATCKADMGDPIGLHNFSLVSMPELDAVGCALKDCAFFSYSYLSGTRTAIEAMMIALLPLSERYGVRLVRGIFRRNRLPVAGFVVADVAGRLGGQSVSLRSCITFDAGHDYWINAIALSTTARSVREGKTRAGVHFLFESVDPAAFLTDLQAAGVNISDR